MNETSITAMDETRYYHNPWVEQAIPSELPTIQFVETADSLHQKCEENFTNQDIGTLYCGALGQAYLYYNLALHRSTPPNRKHKLLLNAHNIVMRHLDKTSQHW